MELPVNHVVSGSLGSMAKLAAVIRSDYANVTEQCTVRVSHSLVVLESLVYGIRFEEEWLPRVPTNLTAPAAGYATSFNGQVLPFPSVSLYIFGVARVTNSHIRGDIAFRRLTR